MWGGAGGVGVTPRTGKQSRDRGEQFEADLLRAYRPPSVYLQRTSPPWRYVRAGRVLKVVVTEEGAEILTLP